MGHYLKKRRQKNLVYDVYIQKRVIKYVRKLKDKKLKTIIKNVIYDEIAPNPYEAGDSKSGDLNGFYAYKLHYSGIQYRIAYTIDDDGNLVIIALAGTREKFYETLKRIVNN
ncbi:MAG: type II toxin-antitoxin system RelE/ParE family toxin [Lactobacillus crispatus]|jgi:mRNA-degrading endonuclease RelE of RelBE toxin-antitoxin system|nr:type II toxin-antitoxin system RelE/ParE family toxin [Lactobacillus crispatus]MCI1493059.1 type II toxin-antitoxin system RelE/ParE family toxin [Lactobacillus crispatus]MCI1524065.1 type II toxin-antitoxin system RelE/ParE family toxin [Lactobacillus crispatus]